MGKCPKCGIGLPDTLTQIARAPYQTKACLHCGIALRPPYWYHLAPIIISIMLLALLFLDLTTWQRFTLFAGGMITTIAILALALAMPVER